MASDNFVQIIGTLTRDPELRFAPAGHAVCNFGIAWNPRVRAADGTYSDGEASYFNCSAWRDLGEHIAASLTKGNRVIVTGSVRARDWEDKDGNKRTSIEIDVEDCAPSLRWAQAQVERTTRSGGSARPDAGGAARGPDPVYGDEIPF